MKSALPALFAGAAGIACSALFVKVSEAGPVSTGFWRVCLALPVLWTWAAWDAHRHRRTTSATDVKLMVLAGVCFAGDLGFWHWAIRFTSVANSVLLVNIAPIFVTLATWFLYRRAPSGHFLAGLTAALAGMFLLLRGDFHAGGGALLGDALSVVTAVFYASYLLTVSRVRASVSTARLMAVSATVVALILLPIAILSGERFFPVTAHGWALLAGLALISHVIGQGLIVFALAHLPGTFASVALLVEAVVAAALAWILLGESLTPLAIIGGVLVLAGIRIAHGAERAPRPVA